VFEIFLGASVTACGNDRHKQRGAQPRGGDGRKAGQREVRKGWQLHPERLKVPALIYDLMQRARNVIFRRAARRCILNARALSDAAAAPRRGAESVIGVSFSFGLITSTRRVSRCSSQLYSTSTSQHECLRDISLIF